MMICLDPYSILEEERDRLRAELAQAREERDKFEAESEQKGADLMAAEGVIAEIIDAYERSASSELGQLIEDARAARAKEGEKR